MRVRLSFPSHSIVPVLSLLIFCSVSASTAFTQSGSGGSAGRRTMTLNVIARAPEGKVITKEDFDLYDDGIPQEVLKFSRLDAGSRIVLMIDSSASLKVDMPDLQKGVLAIVNELYEDDQMMVVGYNESAEIIEDMTGELEKLQAASTKIIRKGFPNLFDALIAVSDSLAQQAKTGNEKRAIILISDGYDSESKTKFDEALRSLQEENIVLYAIKATDRTRGALLRDKPKPPAALEKLTVGTGGAIFPFEKVAEAAKIISDDLRKNWYRLVYIPSGINAINTRRLLIICREKDVELRTKGSHPGRYH
ncbi:MAG TPA: VWA domain-containing protein [Blastocatellia bacterium]|nr:VWA domain-containing protein [Blastocatellia bacterium]